MGILAEAILLDEVGVLQAGEVAGGVGDWLDLAIRDITFDRGPALSALFAAAFPPSADIDCAPCGDESKDIFEG